MKRFTSLIVMIALLLTTLVAAGQATRTARAGVDTMLADGNPPLTQEMVNNLVGFFEFAFEGTFTNVQRREFQQQLVTSWRGNDDKAIDSVVSLLKINAQLPQLSADQRLEVQKQSQATLLEEFRKQPDNETGRLLLAVYEDSHGAKRTNGPESRERATPWEVSTGRASGIPAEIVGSWRAGTVSSTSFMNKNTGSYAAPSGTQASYTIFADGRYEYAGMTQQSMYNCTTRFMTYKTGVVAINGSTLTFIPKNSQFTSEDTCMAKNNYKKAAGMERETYQWRLERDEYGVKICFQNETVNGCAYKQALGSGR